jgi:hypothetical protein
LVSPELRFTAPRGRWCGTPACSTRAGTANVTRDAIINISWVSYILPDDDFKSAN